METDEGISTDGNGSRANGEKESDVLADANDEHSETCTSSDETKGIPEGKVEASVDNEMSRNMNVSSSSEEEKENISQQEAGPQDGSVRDTVAPEKAVSTQQNDSESDTSGVDVLEKTSPLL